MVWEWTEWIKTGRICNVEVCRIVVGDRSVEKTADDHLYEYNRSLPDKRDVRVALLSGKGLWMVLYLCIFYE